MQINLGHRVAAHDALMYWLLAQKEYWVVCVQEPYFSKKGVPRVPEKYGAFWKDEGAKAKRAMILAPKRYNGYLVTQHSTVDRAVVRFSYFNISMVSIYCAVDKDMSDSMSGLISEIRGEGNVICCLDSNAHHGRWGSILQKRPWKGKRRGVHLCEIIDENDMFICNEPPHPPTFIRDTTVSNTSHIDVTIVSRSVFNSIRDWHVSDDTFSSDHCSIKFVYECLTTTEEEIESPIATPWKKPSNKMNEVMVRALTTCGKGMKWVNYVHEVEETINVHSEQIKKVLVKMFQTGKQRKGAKMYWWNEQVNAVYLKMRTARRRMRKYRHKNLKEEFNESRREFRRVVRQAKLEAWQKFTSEISDPWDKLIRIVKATTSGKIQTRTLSDLEGNFAGSMKDTLWLLGRQFFPQPIEKSVVHIDIEQQVENALGNMTRGPTITICEFRKALQEMTTGTAPGLDLITNNVVRILATNGGLEGKYLRLFNTCLRYHYFPQTWKKAKIVLIPKPTAIENSAKSFRPISLTSSFSKLFERIILARLLHYLSLSNRMTNNQHAYRRGASTQTALYEVFDVVQSALSKRGGGICVITFLDISGAFDCTWHHGILHKLLVYGVPLYLIAWLKSFLQGRIAYFNEGSEEYEVKLHQGCPQGGVLSPILWNVLFNEMLALPVSKSADRLQCMKVVGYADDAAIVCKGSTIEQISKVINEQLEKIREWAVLNRVKFNPSKLAVITISNKLARPMPATIYYDKIPVNEVSSYKYLGLLVDTKLKWDLQITEVLRKMSVITKSLAGLSRGNWGVRLDIYRMLFHSIYMPVMLYGIGIWGWKAASKTVSAKFDKEIRRYGLMATRCQRSTSNVFIQNLLKTQSFSQILQYEVLKVSINQFHVLSSKRQQVYETYTKNIKVREVAQCMDQHFHMLRRGIESRIHEVEFDDENKRYEVHPAKWVETKVVIHDKVRAIARGADKRGWVVYTDASASSYGVGWSYVAFKNGYCQSTCYGSLTKCSVFLAEAYAVLQAVRYVVTISDIGKKEVIEIRSDAQGLVRTLAKYVHTNAVLYAIKEELRKACVSGKTIVLRWIPGHSDISGNELADRIAKTAVDSRRTAYMMVTKKDIVRLFKDRNEEIKTCTWDAYESKNVKQFLPNMQAVNVFLASSPSVPLCQIVSGHTRLNEFVYRILGLLQTAKCECGEAKETVTHFLLECPLYEVLRWEVWEDFYADYEFITKNWTKLDEFVNKTGRFKRSIKENLGRIGENRGL